MFDSFDPTPRQLDKLGVIKALAADIDLATSYLSDLRRQRNAFMRDLACDPDRPIDMETLSEYAGVTLAMTYRIVKR